MRPTRSALLWGLALPAAILGGVCFVGPWALLAVALYLLLWSRIRRWRLRSMGDPPRLASLYATFCVLAKLPEALGVLRYWVMRVLGRRSRLIEYKDRATNAA